MRAAIKVIFAVIMRQRHVVLKLISILCSRHRCRKFIVWQQCDNITTCDNESSAGWLMKSDAVFTQDSLLSWLMCLLSPLIIIPIEVTPETAETWETHFTLSQSPQSLACGHGKTCQSTHKYSQHCQLGNWEIGKLDLWEYFPKPKDRW